MFRQRPQTLAPLVGGGGGGSGGSGVVVAVVKVVWHWNGAGVVHASRCDGRRDAVWWAVRGSGAGEGWGHCWLEWKRLAGFEWRSTRWIDFHVKRQVKGLLVSSSSSSSSLFRPWKLSVECWAASASTPSTASTAWPVRPGRAEARPREFLPPVKNRYLKHKRLLNTCQ
ncbi:hypothetical protein E2C01_046871 [Portunus trituberculatus]|uniref:Uncharacterized protein n=1 Tax=Portunus trituberculatus TaxID=210409 RepID=A0A5B7G7B4_PORTR|nr:hypothetical protein [Portunus trituberculatus]